jgi:hypothetical protein
MDIDCPLLDELDAWFSCALDLLPPHSAVRRDVLLLVGGGATVEEVVSVTAGDCEAFLDHLIVFPPDSDGRSLPLTPAFVEVTELEPGAWPLSRDDAAAAAAVVEEAVAAIDREVFLATGLSRPGGVERVRALRMHAWLHELGAHVGVLEANYGPDLPRLLAAAGTCPAVRRDRDVENLVPAQRTTRVAAVA